MKLKDLFPQANGANQESAANQNDFIPKLKSHRYIELPDVEAANKALDPKLHDINDPILRPDKKVKIDKENHRHGRGQRNISNRKGCPRCRCLAETYHQTRRVVHLWQSGCIFCKPGQREPGTCQESIRPHHARCQGEIREPQSCAFDIQL